MFIRTYIKKININETIIENVLLKILVCFNLIKKKLDLFVSGKKSKPSMIKPLGKFHWKSN
jgi:hypothetical protein